MLFNALYSLPVIEHLIDIICRNVTENMRMSKYQFFTYAVDNR